MTLSFHGHARLARQALRAREGKLKVSALGAQEAQLYGHLTIRELKELSEAGRQNG